MSIESHGPQKSQGVPHEGGQPPRYPDVENPFTSVPDGVRGTNTEGPGYRTGQKGEGDQPAFDSFEPASGTLDGFESIDQFPTHDLDAHTIPTQREPHAQETYPQPHTLPQTEKDTGKNKKPLWLKVGAGVAALAATAGAVTAGISNAKKGEEESGPVNPPAASAPVTPGAGEVVVDPSAPQYLEAKYPSQSDFPHRIDGKEYKGIEALNEAFAVTVDKYPTAEKAIPAIMENINRWVNAGTTPDDINDFGKDNMFSVYKGATASAMLGACGNYITPAWKNVLFGPENTEVINNNLEGFTKFLTDFNEETMSDKMRTVREGDANLFKMDIQVDYSKKTPAISSQTIDETSKLLTFFTTIEDNGDLNSVGDARQGEKADGSGAEPRKRHIESVWKLVVTNVDGEWKITGADWEVDD